MAAPRWMLLLGAAGMLAGLWVDARAGSLLRMLDLCLAAPPGLAALLALHAAELPLAHLGMAAGGLAALPWMSGPPGVRGLCIRVGRNLACSAAMGLGMAAGALAFLQSAPWSAGTGTPAGPVAGMVVAMAAGMIAAMALLEAGHRAWGTWARLLNRYRGAAKWRGAPKRWQRLRHGASDTLKPCRTRL